MRVVIVGGGLMGVVTAYYLLEAGHAVTIVDRRSELAAEGSHANGGILHAGHAEPWNNPAAVAQLARSLVQRDSALRLRAGRLPRMTGWGLRFLWHCRRARREAVTERNTRLAVWSRGLTQELASATGIAFDAAQPGTLKIFRDARRFAHAREAASHIEPLGVRAQFLAPDGVAELEPALAPVRGELAGGIHFVDDATGDAAAFTRALGRVVEQRGGELRLGETVHGLEGGADGVTGVTIDNGVIRGDRYILANGVDAPGLARSLGLRLPIEPVKGYSATLGLAGGAQSPRVALIDDARQVVMARLGQRLRVAGIAEFAGLDRRIEAGLAERVIGDALANVPELAETVDRGKASTWACLRPVSADGAPILGATRIPNLFLNTGAGHLGWTLATGVSRLVAEAVADEPPSLPLEGVTPQRFGA